MGKQKKFSLQKPFIPKNSIIEKKKGKINNQRQQSESQNLPVQSWSQELENNIQQPGWKNLSIFTLNFCSQNKKLAIRLNNLIAFILKKKPDIICLQEISTVRYHNPYNRGRMWITQFKQKLKQFYLIPEDFQDNQNPQFNKKQQQRRTIIITKLKCQFTYVNNLLGNYQNIILPTPYFSCQFQCQNTKKQKVNIIIHSLHLKAGRVNSSKTLVDRTLHNDHPMKTRFEQLVQIQRGNQNLNKDIVIMCGDFNFDYNTDEPYFMPPFQKKYIKLTQNVLDNFIDIQKQYLAQGQVLQGSFKNKFKYQFESGHPIQHSNKRRFDRIMIKFPYTLNKSTEIIQVSKRKRIFKVKNRNNMFVNLQQQTSDHEGIFIKLRINIQNLPRQRTNNRQLKDNQLKKWQQDLVKDKDQVCEQYIYPRMQIQSQNI